MKWSLFYVSCLNCRYFKGSPLGYKYNDMGKCLFYPKVNGRTITYPYAEKVRQDETKCGIKGGNWTKFQD